MEKKQRTIADETRIRIIEAAKTLFLEKGFDGVSINAIAQLAGVNKTLIFHHYQDKVTLWCMVKEAIIENNIDAPEYDLSSAKAYFSSVLAYRFALYENNPELAKLIAWQQVTPDHALLIGQHSASPNHWLKDIKTMQKNGKLKKEIEAKLIMLFIIYSSHAPFLQNTISLSKSQREEYKNIILKACLTQFV